MKNVPFYSNTQDNTSCFQAALQMVLKYFIPEKEYSMEELYKITAKIKDLWTWPQAGIIELKKMGFDIVILDPFNYQRFAKEGGSYLKEAFGEEVAALQIEHSDIEQEVKFTNELLLAEDIQYYSNPTIEDAKKLIEDGFLVIFNINSKALYDEDGYEGHFVVVYEIDDDLVYFNDPGLPPVPNSKVPKEKFEKLWKFTNDAYAFRLTP